MDAQIKKRTKAGKGRPRVSVAAPSDDPRRDILAAAARLFRQHGIAGASVREIAQEAGLRKASLYYYFPSKQDIVHAMAEDVLVPALALQKRLSAAALSEAARLYLYLRRDVLQLCSAPYDCTWLIAQGDLGDEKMQAYWQEREKLLRWLAARVKSGIAKDEFLPLDVRTAAQALLAATEGASAWVDRANERKSVRQADELASLMLRGLLAPGKTVADVKAEAETTRISLES